jgi:hypothetical protein
MKLRTELPMASPEVRYILSGDAGDGAKKAFLFLLEKRGRIGNILCPIRLSGKDTIRNPGLREGIREAGRAMKDYREGKAGIGIPETDYDGMVGYFSTRGTHYTTAYLEENGGPGRMFNMKRYAAATEALLNI